VHDPILSDGELPELLSSDSDLDECDSSDIADDDSTYDITKMTHSSVGSSSRFLQQPTRFATTPHRFVGEDPLDRGSC